MKKWILLTILILFTACKPLPIYDYDKLVNCEEGKYSISNEKTQQLQDQGIYVESIAVIETYRIEENDTRIPLCKEIINLKKPYGPLGVVELQAYKCDLNCVGVQKLKNPSISSEDIFLGECCQDV